MTSWQGPGPRRATPAARMENRSVARMPALYRERPKPHAPACPGLKSSATWRDLDFPVPVSSTGRLRQVPGGKRVTVQRQAEVTPSGGKRIAVWSRETAGAIRSFPADRARQNNICGGRAPLVRARARSQSSRQRAWEKPKPPKASRHGRKQRRHKPECSKDRDDDDEQDIHREYRTQNRRGSS